MDGSDPDPGPLSPVTSWSPAMYEDGSDGPVRPSYLVQLPATLLLFRILTYLPLPSLVSVALTCKQFHTLLTSPSAPLLLYKRELKVAGLLDNQLCSYHVYPIAKRLERLREREARWMHLDWKFRSSIDGPSNDLAVSIPRALDSGSFVIAKDTGRGPLDVYMTKMPKVEEDEATRFWDTLKLGRDVVDIKLAVGEQDLAVYLSCPPGLARKPYIHLIQHSTKKYHPLAATPILNFPEITLTSKEQSSPPILSSEIDICGPCLAVLIQYAWREDSTINRIRCSLFVWNWRTGQMKSEMLGVVNGIAFLRKDLLMVGNIRQQCLDIFHIPPWIPESSDIGKDIVPLQRLLLPTPRLPYAYTSMRAQTGTNCYDTAGGRSDNTRPFMDDPRSAIILFKLTIRVANEDPGHFELVILREAILDMALRARAGVPNFGIVRWDAWGPFSTRFFEDESSEESSGTMGAVHGSRWVRMRAEPVPKRKETPKIHSSIQRQLYRLDVLDFNPAKLKYMRNTTTAAPIDLSSKVRHVNISTSHSHVKIKGGGGWPVRPKRFFPEDIVSYLPFISGTFVFAGAPGVDTNGGYALERTSTRKKNKGVFSSLIAGLASGMGNSGGGQKSQYFGCDWDSVMVDGERVVGIKHGEGLDVMYFG